MGERPEMSTYAKAAAYAGLALVTPASGWICYKLGQFLDKEWGTGYLYLVGLVAGCAAGMYETFRQAMKLEGLDKPGGKDGRGGGS
jgi:F0F1-type ATP synthase assembly protein I